MNELTKNQKIFLIIFLLIVVAVLGYTIWNFTKDNSNETEIDDLMINANTENTTNALDTQATTAPSEKIIIYIIGCVKTPGVYELDVDSRVSNAVDAAGGLSETADLTKINLAYKLEDGQKITIPSINDKTDEDSTYEDFITDSPENTISQTNLTNSSKSNIVNINSATQTELETLPGIGPSIASKIISYRNENGKFRLHWRYKKCITELETQNLTLLKI